MLQEQLHALLGGRREVRLSAGDRVDLLVGAVAVEVKCGRTAATLGDVGRQVDRYLAHDEVASALLVTNRYAHTRLAGTRLGKRVGVVVLGPLGGSARVPHPDRRLR